jgi:hypothetical protein
MIRIPRKRTLAALAVAAGLLGAAAPAGAHTSPVSDGSSNTIMFSLPEVDDEVHADGIIAILIGAKARGS